MPLKLPRLQRSVAVVDEKRTPATGFIQWWQRVCEEIENLVNDVVIAALVRLGAVELQADGTATLAESAINPGGTIKDDKVLTDSMIDNAATVISSLFYNASAATLGTAGSYVDLPGGPATVSIATGTKSVQQGFVKALIGTRRGGGSNNFVAFRCRRNDATILAQTYIIEVTDDQFIIPLSFIDPNPTVSTTHTYTIEASSDNSATQFREVYVEGFLGTTG